MPLVPIVISVFGVVNATASEWFSRVEEAARTRGRPLVPEVCGPRNLLQLVSRTAILEAAAIAADAHSQRKVF